MWVNLIGFKFIWLGLVFVGDAFIPLAIALCVMHFLYCSNKKAEAELILLVTLVGIAVDSLLIYLGFFSFSGSVHLPYWLIVLWLCFAATISQGLAFLKGNVLMQFILGALFAPLSYLAGENLLLINFEYSIWISFIVLAAVWGFLMICIFLLEQKIYRVEDNNA